MSPRRASPPSAPTLVHVARLAGVGLGTASRALSGQGYIKGETLEKILEAAERLGYQKNELARSLKEKRSGAIGLIVPDIGGPFMAGCVRAIQRKLRQNGYTLVITFSDGLPGVEQDELSYLLRYQVDGLIVIPAVGSAPHFQSPALLRLPVVAFDQPIEGTDFDAVLVMNKQGAHEAVRHLIDQGHQRVACLGVNRHLYSIRERLAGYRSAVRQSGLEAITAFVEPGVEAVGKQIDAWRRLPAPPTALFSLNELTTTQIVEAFLQRGMRMPADMAFAGFDDIELGPYLDPPLTAVLQPAALIGETAVERLLQRLRMETPPSAEHIMLSPALVIRGSSGAPPKQASATVAKPVKRPAARRADASRAAKR